MQNVAKVSIFKVKSFNVADSVTFHANIDLSHLFIQAFQLASKFHTNTTNTSDVIVNNFRPVQSLNGRSITKPRPLVQSNAAAPVAVSYVLSALLALVVSMVSLH